MLNLFNNATHHRGALNDENIDNNAQNHQNVEPIRRQIIRKFNDNIEEYSYGYDDNKEIFTENKFYRIQYIKNEGHVNMYGYMNTDDFIKNIFKNMLIPCEDQFYEIHELLYKDVPSKIYVDFDASIQSHYIADIKEHLEEFIECIQQQFQEIYSAKFDYTIPVYVYTDATRKIKDDLYKFSRHIVFPQYSLYEGLDMVKYIVTKALDICSPMVKETLRPYIDFGVYHQTQSFRVPYSYKLPKED